MSCPSAKVQYRSPSHALKALQQMRSRRAKRGAKKKIEGVDVYRCALVGCGAWHLGNSHHPPKKELNNG
jgi:hypothetical protein